MLDDEIYTRQNAIQGINVFETATVIGCGGTGFWTALFLAMSGVKNIILIDMDKLEISNLNRLLCKDSAVGHYKVDIVRQLISQIRPSARVEVHKQRVNNEEECALIRGSVFCCTDNLKSQQLICAYAKKNNLPYQRIGYDGTFLNVSRAFPLSFSDEPEDAGGYSITPSWVVPAVLAAALGVSSQMYSPVCIMEDISSIVTKSSSFLNQKLVDKYIREGIRRVVDSPSNYIDGYESDCDNCDQFSEGRESGYRAGFEEGGIHEAQRRRREGVDVREVNLETITDPVQLTILMRRINDRLDQLQIINPRAIMQQSINEELTGGNHDTIQTQYSGS